MKGSLATPRRAASSAAAPRATWPSSAYMRVRREAHSACAARSGLLCSPPPAQRSSTTLCSVCCLVPPGVSSAIGQPGWKFVR